MKLYQKIGFYWAILSVILIVFGLILSSASVLIDNSKAGLFMLLTGVSSFILYMLSSFFMFFKTKKGEVLETLIMAYLFICVSFIIGGLVGAFMSYPDGMNFFLFGLFLFGIYWLGVMFYNIFRK